MAFDGGFLLAVRTSPGGFPVFKGKSQAASCVIFSCTGAANKVSGHLWLFFQLK
jgi:hypothetical protein